MLILEWDLLQAPAAIPKHLLVSFVIGFENLCWIREDSKNNHIYIIIVAIHVFFCCFYVWSIQGWTQQVLVRDSRQAFELID